ncbi:ribonuclease D [Bartonella sp. DGB1]|uniref:ribonuclease D n=1 Tax=Bartonella sp. DGB1 TaxID=3239807 RepID=UPI003523849E
MPLINTNPQLIESLKSIEHTDFVTIDTEFIREKTFWAKLCLIQIATRDKVILIDPLAENINLQPFFDLMQNKKILKIFHSARQDIEIIYHLSKIIPEPIYDTQIAAMICGYNDSISYEKLVSDICKKNLSKASRFSNWENRPLSAQQLEYAEYDVTYLVDIYLYLKNKIEQQNRQTWGDDELAILTDKNTYDSSPELAWHKIKYNFKKSKEKSILQNLAFWRECLAQTNNVPRSHILKDEILIDIAQQQPKTINSLFKLRRFPLNSLQKKLYAEDIINCVKNSTDQIIDDLPKIKKYKNFPSELQGKLEILKLLLKIIGEQEKVAPRLIASVADLEKFILAKDKSESKLFQGWRKKIFGAKATKLLNGQLALKINNNKIEFFTNN